MNGASRYLEVRCCCEPARLLGLLPIPDNIRLEPGQRVKWVISARHEPRIRGTQIDLEAGAAQVLELEMALWSNATFDGVRTKRDGGLAFKSDDTPLEVLRLVPGFVDTTGRHARITARH